MTKNVLWFLLIVVVGALIGSFLGKIIGISVPNGAVKDLFSTEINAGLSPATLDLRIMELTFGCMLKFNIMSVLGIICSALIFKKIIK